MSATLQKPKPSLAAVILIPLAIWVITGGIATALLINGFVQADNSFGDLDAFPAGQATEVELRETGGYRIWLLREGVDNETGFNVAATATVTGPNGASVPVEEYVGSLTYSGSGPEGTAVLTFDAPEAGVYTISASPVDGEPARFAVGNENPLADVGRGFLFFFLIGTVGFLIALVLFIVMMVRRGRSRRSIQQSFGGVGPPPGAGFGPPPGAGFGPPPGAGFGPPPGPPPPSGFGPSPGPPGPFGPGGSPPGPPGASPWS